jgi:chromosome segregation ATPase
MADTSKQTPLTVETFKELLMPEINKQFKTLRNDLTKLAHTVNDLKETVEETNEKVKYLPTTEIYLTSQDKLVNELQKSREATEFTGQHYEDTNERIDKIDDYLNINSRLAID